MENYSAIWQEEMELRLNGLIHLTSDPRNLEEVIKQAGSSLKQNGTYPFSKKSYEKSIHYAKKFSPATR
jgi:hypothetical protein